MSQKRAKQRRQRIKQLASEMQVAIRKFQQGEYPDDISIKLSTSYTEDEWREAAIISGFYIDENERIMF